MLPKTCRCGATAHTREEAERLFARGTDHSDGLASVCRSCRAAQWKQWSSTHQRSSRKINRSRNAKGPPPSSRTARSAPDRGRGAADPLDFEIALDFAPLIAAARRPGASVTSCCNALGMSPAALEELIRAARASGIAVQVAHDTVAIRGAAPSDVPVEVAQIVGDEQRIAVISDTHFGSKYCMRAELADFIRHAYSKGVREVLHAGDWLDGCYEHGRFELTHHGIDAQSVDAIESLPRLEGLTYHGITGNHDHTFTSAVGVEVGQYLESRFRAAGRTDIRIHGNRSAYLRVRGALVHLWHPQGGVPYALSYRLQKQVESYSPGLKPDILLTGHLHKSVQVATRGVHAYLVPCWQHGGSAFSNSLVGAPALGGLVLTWATTTHGTLRSLRSELVSYYHDERPRDVA